MQQCQYKAYVYQYMCQHLYQTNKQSKPGSSWSTWWHCPFPTSGVEMPQCQHHLQGGHQSCWSQTSRAYPDCTTHTNDQCCFKICLSTFASSMQLCMAVALNDLLLTSASISLQMLRYKFGSELQEKAKVQWASKLAKNMRICVTYCLLGSFEVSIMLLLCSTLFLQG